MRRFAFARCVATVVFALVCSSYAFSADDYAIKITRNGKVGDVTKFKTTHTERRSSVVTADGKKINEEVSEYTISISAQEKVLEVSPAGSTSKSTVTIEKCVITEKGKTSDLIPAGKTVEMNLRVGKDNTSYSVGGAELPADVSAKLKDVISLRDPNYPTDDDASGTKDRKKVGDTWEANKDVMVKQAEMKGILVKKDAITANTKFAEVKAFGGDPCTVLEFTMGVKFDPSMRLGNAPDWLHIQSGKMEGTMKKAVPVDTSRGTRWHSDEMKMTMVVSGKAPNGQEVVSTVTGTATTEGTIEPVEMR